MRILQVHNYHLSKGGDMEVLAHERQLLEAAGHAVTEYSLAATAELGLSPVRAGVKAVWNREAQRRVEALLLEFQPDVMHVHDPFPLLSPAVFRVAHRHDVATVTTLHAYRYSCIAGSCWRDGDVCEDCVGSRLKLPGLRHRCYHDSLAASGALTLSLAVHRSVGTLHHHVDRYLTLTDFARRLMIRDGYPADKVAVKPNSVADPGLPATRRRDEDQAPYFAFIGRLLPIKGVSTLLRAWDDVPDGPRLRIAGDGPLRPEVEARAAADSSVDFLGWVDDEAQIRDLMAGAEAVLVPSEWYEGQPLVILRALAVGTPVVVSDLDNICEAVLADDAGFSFPVRDAAALGALLTRLVEKPEQVAQRRNPARVSYETRYSPQADLDLLVDVYRAVVSGVRRTVG